MRVIAGRYRGRRLQAPAGTTTRPITDRVKETLFNILGSRWGTPGALPDIAVIDVFAGPGSLGIEALSRGARICTFVERDRRALRTLRENLTTLEAGTTGTILADNAWTMRPPCAAGSVGLIFVDPPYRDTARAARVLDLLERLAPLLSADGWLVYRHPIETTLDPTPLRGLRFVEERTYARMQIMFFTPADATTTPDVSVNPSPSP